MHEPRLEPVVHDREELARHLLAADGLTATQTTFTQAELVRAVAGSLRRGATAEQILAAADELSRLPGIEQVEPGDIPGRPARFTTRGMLEVEREALALATAGRDVGAPAADGRTVLRGLLDCELSREQQRLVREAALSRDRVVCVVGVAGSGKTTALQTLNEIHGASGVQVMGAAPSGRAADELQTATGIPSSTLHRLLLDADRDRGLPHGCVLVVDEAGMAETRVLAPVLRLVERAEGKAILVGDPRQLPAVGAGGLYPALCEELGALELTENRRQHEPSERQALARLRNGDPEPYLAYAAKHGRLQVDDNPAVAKQRLLEDWWQSAASASVGPVMIAYRRTDIRDLNEAAHALMLRADRLGPDALLLGEREFRVGDRVLCRQNDPRLGLRNGTRATIVDLDQSTLTLRTDQGTLRKTPVEYAAKHLDHGYALTGHAAQGATVDRAFVLVEDRGALQEWGYVACSRARKETRLYLATPPLDADLPGRAPQSDRVPERVVHALTASASEPLAIDQADRDRRTTERILAMRSSQQEQKRARTEQRLSDAEAKLERLGWRGRRKQGAKLRAEIDFQRSALRLADEKRAEPPPLPRVAPSREPSELAYKRSRELARKREPIDEVRERALERDRGFGLEW